MICLYDKNETVFSDVKPVILEPSVCTVSEVAGGSYELHMELPMDQYGKFRKVEENAIIKAPVPPAHIPQITMPQTVELKTKTYSDASRKIKLYSKLPVYKSTGVTADDLGMVRQNPTAYLWYSDVTYRAGALVVDGRTADFGGYIYKAKQENRNIRPMSDLTIWGYLGKVEASSQTEGLTEYIPGVVIEELGQNVTLVKIADYDKYYVQVTAPSNNKGYVLRDETILTETPHSGEVIPAQDITEQLFRIYSVTCEDDTQTVTAEAKHISYDFAGNMLLTCKVTKADPQAAIANIQGALLMEDDRIIACNITGKTITQDWSYKNPVNALLDPDNGVVKNLDARLIRNNADFFILDGSSAPDGISIDYGENMIGVSWERNCESVITRVVPRCTKKNNEYLYIENVYVDSPKYTAHPENYPVIKTEVLNCSYSVGKKFTKPDGEEVTLDEDGCKTQMAADAAERFSKDHVDDPEITLDVEFVLLGDTEQYKQYRGLQTVNLYDKITVNASQSGVTATAQVTEYEYDSILKRYNSIRVSNVSRFIRKLSGFRFASGSVGIDKLSNDVLDEIRTGGVVSENSGAGDNGTPSGGGGTVDVVLNSKTADGLVLKGQNQSKKVWATNANGEPGWRDLSELE